MQPTIGYLDPDNAALLRAIFSRSNPSLPPRRKAATARTWLAVARAVAASDWTDPVWAGACLCEAGSCITLPARYVAPEQSGSYRSQARDRGGVGGSVIFTAARLTIRLYPPYRHQSQYYLEDRNTDLTWCACHLTFVNALLRGDDDAALAVMELSESPVVYDLPAEGVVRLTMAAASACGYCRQGVVEWLAGHDLALDEHDGCDAPVALVRGDERAMQVYQAERRRQEAP